MSLTKEVYDPSLIDKKVPPYLHGTGGISIEETNIPYQKTPNYRKQKRQTTESKNAKLPRRVHCISIPITLNRDYLMSNLKFVRSCAHNLSRKLRNSSMTVMENTLCSSRTRLCRYILGSEVGGVFRDIMTDTAASVGTSYRHLYRMMGELVKGGILEKRPSGCRILDYGRLKVPGGI